MVQGSRYRFTASAMGMALLMALNPVTAQASEASDAQINKLVDTQAPAIAANALKIWSFAEIGYQEKQSSVLLQRELTKAGFKVEAGVAGMPTAFVARFRTGDGPVIALLAEYDALPGLAQTAKPSREEIVGARAGHGCGHNLFGAASVGAAIAVKQWMQREGIKGEIRLYGTPAEEAGAGKVFMVRDGLFRDVDAALHWHPDSENSAAQTSSLAAVGIRYRFKGVAAHAAAAPEHGRSALDGVELMDVAVNFMREHVPQETRIHSIIKHGGTAPNVVPAFAESEYYIRSPKASVLEQIVDRVAKAAQGAAMATGTTVEIVLDTGVYDLLPNDTLGKLMDAKMRAVAMPKYKPAQQAFATEIATTFDKAPFKPGSESVIQPYASGTPSMGSTDVGDISYVVPTAGIVVATFVPGTQGHSWQAVAAGGTDIGTDGAVIAARVMAMTAAELFVEPARIAEAKAELDRRRGADFKYVSLLGDAKPDLSYGLDSQP